MELRELSPPRTTLLIIAFMGHLMLMMYTPWNFLTISTNTRLKQEI